MPLCRPDPAIGQAATDPGIEEAWSAEALRRLEEIDNGTVTGVPVEQAIARTRNAIR